MGEMLFFFYQFCPRSKVHTVKESLVPSKNLGLKTLEASEILNHAYFYESCDHLILAFHERVLCFWQDLIVTCTTPNRAKSMQPLVLW